MRIIKRSSRCYCSFLSCQLQVQASSSHLKLFSEFFKNINWEFISPVCQQSFQLENKETTKSKQAFSSFFLSANKYAHTDIYAESELCKTYLHSSQAFLQKTEKKRKEEITTQLYLPANICVSYQELICKQRGAFNEFLQVIDRVQSGQCIRCCSPGKVQRNVFIPCKLLLFYQQSSIAVY